MPESIKARLDLRGVPCPTNWVRSKLGLEELEGGELLELLLDDGGPICNVPRSARLEGNVIVKLESVESYFRVILEKRSLGG